MRPVKLTYGEKGMSEIRSFLNEHKEDDYTLSIYNILEEATMEIMCSFEEMLDVIMWVSSLEHDFPAWIGKNELSDSYVVGMNFTRGNLRTPSVYKWENGKLVNLA